MYIYIHTKMFPRTSLLPNLQKTSILYRALKLTFFRGTAQVKSKSKGQYRSKTRLVAYFGCQSSGPTKPHQHQHIQFNVYFIRTHGLDEVYK